MSSIYEELIKYSKLLSEKNLVIGPGGNTSCRDGEFMYIKPSGLTFSEISVKDLVKVEIKSGKVIEHEFGHKPSSEILMHLYIYQTSDIKCVFHAHPPIVNGLTAGGIKIQHMFPDSVVYLGKDIPMVEYCTPCGAELANLVINNLKNNYCIILKNHGALSIGNNPKIAFTRMEILEGLAQTLWITLSSGVKLSDVRFLTDKEINDVLNLENEKFRQKLIES